MLNRQAVTGQRYSGPVFACPTRVRLRWCPPEDAELPSPPASEACAMRHSLPLLRRRAAAPSPQASVRNLETRADIERRFASISTSLAFVPRLRATPS